MRANIGHNHGHRYLVIFSTVWTVSFLLTLPIIYFTVPVKLEEDYICKIGWSFLSRDQCFVIMQHPDSFMECPENEILESRCEIDKYFLEKIYFAVFTIIGFILPLVVTLLSYYFIMRKVHRSRMQIKKVGGKTYDGDSRKYFNRTIVIFFGWFLLMIVKL